MDAYRLVAFVFDGDLALGVRAQVGEFLGRAQFSWEKTDKVAALLAAVKKLNGNSAAAR